MFDNIGHKIKVLVKIITIFEIVVFVILGVICLNEHRIGYGLLFLIGGPLISWISSFFMYAFGQLVENSDTQTKIQSEILNRLNVKRGSIVNNKIITKTENKENSNDKEEVNKDEEKIIVENQESLDIEEIKKFPANDIKLYDNLMKLDETETLAYANIVQTSQMSQFVVIRTKSIEYRIGYNSYDEAREGFVLINQKILTAGVILK